MSYYYKNNEYEYDDYSNHGNNDEYEYNSYSNYAESDHCDLDPEPPPSKLNLYEYHGDVNATKFSNDTDHENMTEAKGLEYETRDGKAKVDELGELRYKDEAAINERYKLGELKHDG